MKPYAPQKSHKWGYKLFFLCDANEIVLNFEIFSEKILEVEGISDLCATFNIVL